MRALPNQHYAQLRMKTLSGREIEAAVLEKAAFQLQRAKARMKPQVLDTETEEALSFNKRVWDVLRADWQQPENQLPHALRESLLSLSVFMTKHFLAFRANPNPESLDVVIQINENLVKGLRPAATETPELANA